MCSALPPFLFLRAFSNVLVYLMHVLISASVRGLLHLGSDDTSSCQQFFYQCHEMQPEFIFSS